MKYRNNMQSLQMITYPCFLHISERVLRKPYILLFHSFFFFFAKEAPYSIQPLFVFLSFCSKDQSESLPLERDFKVPNIGKVIEEGKKTPTKFCNIKLCQIESKLEPEMYTASGWPSVSGDALKTLAGKVSAEFDFTDEAEVLDPKEKDKEAAYGTAYAAFGGGQKGKEACHAIAALCEVCSIDSLISNFILPLQVILLPYFLVTSGT